MCDRVSKRFVTTKTRAPEYILNMLRENTYFCDVCSAEISKDEASQALSTPPENLTVLLTTIDLAMLSRKPDGTVCIELCGDCQPDVKQKLEAILAPSNKS